MQKINSFNKLRNKLYKRCSNLKHLTETTSKEISLESLSKTQQRNFRYIPRTCNLKITKSPLDPSKLCRRESEQIN